MENRKELTHETIFFALFKTDSSHHDRSTFYASKKTFKEFMEWAIEKRSEIELERGKPVVMYSFDIKYNSF